MQQVTVKMFGNVSQINTTNLLAYYWKKDYDKSWQKWQKKDTKSINEKLWIDQTMVKKYY